MRNPQGSATLSKAAIAARTALPKLGLWEYFVAQVTKPVLDEVQPAKHERVYNFLHVPQKLEQVRRVV